MIRNLVKLSILGVVAGISMQTSSQIINKLVIEVNSREKTITDAIIQKQVEVAFEEADKKIAEAVEKEEIVIEVEEVKMKPPLPEPKPKPTEEEQLEQEVAEEEVEVQQEVVEGEVANPVEGLESIDFNQYGELTKKDIEYIGNYLVDNYFLHGYVYYTNEEDVVRKERKKLAHEMEGYVIDSLGEAFRLVTDLSALNGEMLGQMKVEAVQIAEEFTKVYSGIEAKGNEFKGIYDQALEYFKVYITTLEKAETTIKTIEQTTNKMLVLPLMLKSINEDLLPGAKEVLDQGFALKAKTNAIYTEGLDASFLLEPKEVIDIILNPGSILNQKAPELEGEETKPKEEVKPEENNPAGETEPEGGSNPEGETESEGESNPEGETEPEGGSNPAGETESEGGSNPEGETEPEGGSNPAGETESEGESNPEGETESEGNTEGESPSEGEIEEGTQIS